MKPFALTLHEIHGGGLQIEVTPSGKDLLTQSKSSVDVVDRALLTDLSPDERRMVRRCLTWIASELGA